MKFFIIEGTFKDPVPIGKEELQQTIAEHLIFLQKGFDEGWILVSGPKALAGGGIIIMKAASITDVENYLTEDPLKITGVQDYRIVEFKFHDCQDMLKQWFN